MVRAFFVVSLLWVAATEEETERVVAEMVIFKETTGACATRTDTDDVQFFEVGHCYAQKNIATQKDDYYYKFSCESGVDPETGEIHDIRVRFYTNDQCDEPEPGRYLTNFAKKQCKAAAFSPSNSDMMALGCGQMHCTGTPDQLVCPAFTRTVAAMTMFKEADGSCATALPEPQYFEVGHCYEKNGKHYIFDCEFGEIQVWFFTDDQAPCDKFVTNLDQIGRTIRMDQCERGGGEPFTSDMRGDYCGQMLCTGFRDQLACDVVASGTEATITFYDDRDCKTESTNESKAAFVTEKGKCAPRKGPFTFDMQLASCGTLKCQGGLPLTCGPSGGKYTEVAHLEMFTGDVATCKTAGDPANVYITTGTCHNMDIWNYKITCGLAPNPNASDDSKRGVTFPLSFAAAISAAYFGFS